MEKHRTTLYLEEPIYRAVRMKAAATNTNISSLVNKALRVSLAEDLEDLEALADRAEDPGRPFEDFLKELRDAELL
jgi:hypothetical protein